MGDQVIPLVAMLLGWSDGYLVAPMRTQPAKSTVSLGTAVPFGFTRVVT
jgi:hypothetical protein